MTQRPNPLNAYLGHLGVATIDWIGVRPRRREPLEPVSILIFYKEPFIARDCSNKTVSFKLQTFLLNLSNKNSPTSTRSLHTTFP